MTSRERRLMMEHQTARLRVMISLAIFLAQRQIVFFVWVTFGERKWSILAERRGPADQGHFPPLQRAFCKCRVS
jgi:hypothetical protein